MNDRNDALEGEVLPTIPVAKTFRVRMDDLAALSGEIPDTVIRIDACPERMYPDPQAVSLLHFAAESKTFTLEGFERFRDDCGNDIMHRIQQIVDRHPDVFPKPEKAIKYAFAAPRAVTGTPPLSQCPRCGTRLWPDAYRDMPREKAAGVLLARPHPNWCAECGQRFAYDKDDFMRTQDEIALTLLAHRLANPVEQPELDMQEEAVA